MNDDEKELFKVAMDRMVEIDEEKNTTIKNLQEIIREADSLLSFLDSRDFIRYEAKTCPDPNEVTQLIGKLRDGVTLQSTMSHI